MEKEFNPIIEGMKKACITKEAIASIELDKGQTQTFEEKEFNLSKKIDNLEKALICLLPSDYEKVDYKVLDDVRKAIKEFIQRTEKDMRNHKLSRIGMVERFRKRAGDKFTSHNFENGK